jgi:hypothetical protein
MEKKIIELVLILVCFLIFARGVLYPLSALLTPVGPWLVRWFSKFLEKTPLEKQKEALNEAQERIRIAELQKKTMQAEKQAIKIRNSIIDEEFEELDEEYKRTKL